MMLQHCVAPCVMPISRMDRRFVNGAHWCRYLPQSSLKWGHVDLQFVMSASHGVKPGPARTGQGSHRGISREKDNAADKNANNGAGTCEIEHADSPCEHRGDDGEQRKQRKRFPVLQLPDWHARKE